MDISIILFYFVFTKRNTMDEKQIDDEIIDEVKRVINYQTNIGWLIAIGVSVVLLILNHYKVI